MKDDMISRQAAIETVRKAQSIGQAHRMLAQLPSAQLAQDLTNGCTDTISRVAAISICDNAIDLWNGQLGTGALVAVRDAIMALPPAQPDKWDDTVYRKAVEMLLAYFVPEERYAEAVDGLRRLPSAQPNLSEAYSKAVFTWLMDYQIRAAELKGRYTPYEVLSWVINDWRKENG